MFVVLCYDVAVRRNKTAAKISEKFLHRTQNSVFEGYLTQWQLSRLTRELQRVILPDEDAVALYLYDYGQAVKRLCLGKKGNPPCDIL